MRTIWYRFLQLIAVALLCMACQAPEGRTVDVNANALPNPAAGSGSSAVAPSECEVADAWVTAQGEHLPATLTELDAVSPTYRRAVFARSSAATQRAFWRAHLTKIERETAAWSDEQSAVFARAQALLSSMAFEVAADTDSALDVELQALKDDAVRVFGQGDATRIFAELGESSEPTTYAAAALRNCTCSLASEYCGDRACIASNPPDCKRNKGCGTFWLYTCTGLCR